MAPSTIALIISAGTVVLFVWGIIPLPITAIGAALTMAVFGCIPFSSAFAGFSNDALLMVIGSMVIGETLFVTGVAERIGAAIIRRVGTNERLFVVVCVVLAVVLSAFLSNTAVVAMLLPIVSAVAAASNGAITKKNSFMAIGFAANIGGGMTLVGSTTNVIGQGLLVDNGLEPMSFFELLPGSIPRFLFIIVFYATVGYGIQQKIFNFEEITEEAGAESEERQYSKSKMLISIGILVFAVVGFCSGIWTIGGVAMAAAVLCTVTGCISMQEMFRRIDWGTVWVMAGSLGLAAGISQSGAGQVIADFFVGFLGTDASMFKLMTVFTLLSVFLANLMSSTAAMAMLAPIAMSVCGAYGFAVKPVFMVIIWSLNLAFLTPTATVPITMTLQGGYQFLDYTRVGVFVMIGCLILSIASYPFVFSL